ncbi:FecCD family ABC transporter permease [Stetteria hydrogenophila]
MHRGRPALFLALLTAALLAACAASVSIGSYPGVGLDEVLDYLAGRGLPAGVRAVVELRLSRTVAAALVGAALSAGGAGLQFVLRNPLADPYILGISSGAALALILASSLGLASPAAVQLVAFLGGLAALGVAFALAAAAGGGRLSLIIAGVVVGYAAWSLGVILLYRMGPEAGRALSWLYGTLAYTTPSVLRDYSPGILAGLGVLALRAGRVSKLLLGEEVAESMGVNVARLRLEVVAAAGLATASSVAIAGPVGFIGLAGAWLARALVGSVFTRLLPASAMAGAAVLVAADAAARLLGPGEPPLTALTTLAGIPATVYVLTHLRGEGWG